MTEARQLYENVIEKNYCIGCGACASVKDSPFEMKMDKFGNIVAQPIKNLDNNSAKVLKICPFSNDAKNEDEISDIIFPKIKNVDPKIGRHIECFAGFVEKGDFRKKGSSGGIAKWLGYTLLKENKIDYFVQILPNKTNNPNKPLFEYVVISDKDEVLKGSKSAYYPVTLVGVIKTLREKEGRYAITGVPCFIKTLRLLALEDETLKQRITYTIGIICGGMKSANHSKLIGWQLGVKPENLVGIDFRRKYKDKPASNKIYQVWSDIDNSERFEDSYKIFGTDWGSGFFKPKACDFCDDIVGETADISIGDAWLPQFVNDPKGTSILVVRNAEILEIVNKYARNNTIALHKLTAEEVAVSQEGGFRHRREALSYRIAKKEIKKSWYPTKRVKANQYKITRKRKRIYSLREKIARQSHTSSVNALNKNDLNVFFNEMNPLSKKYNNTMYGGLWIRAFRKIKRITHAIVNKNSD